MHESSILELILSINTAARLQAFAPSVCVVVVVVAAAAAAPAAIVVLLLLLFPLLLVVMVGVVDREGSLRVSRPGPAKQMASTHLFNGEEVKADAEDSLAKRQDGRPVAG